MPLEPDAPMESSSGPPIMQAADGRAAPLVPAAPDVTGDVARLNLIGESPAFQDCVRQIRRMAIWDATVLIEGETGTGKELAARAIHYLGRRRAAPFIPLNCGALPASVVTLLSRRGVEVGALELLAVDRLYGRCVRRTG